MTKEVKKDLIIGAYDRYGWDQIKFWVNSIDKCGFKGNKVMIVFNSDGDTVKRLADKGFHVVAFNRDANGNFTYSNPKIPVHVDRFFHIWHTLSRLVPEDRPRYVITTDVRDVVFQTDPSQYLSDNLNMFGSGKSIVAASELLEYQHEPWGDQNLRECFGPLFYDMYKDKEIFNVGTIGGTYHGVKDLALMIFQMSLNRPIPIVDQAVFNFLLQQEPYYSDTIKDRGTWAATLGTTLDPNKRKAFEPFWLGKPPTYDNDGTV